MPLLQQAATPTENDGPAPIILRIRVTGMTCAGCAASIQRALEARSDVVSASVSFLSGTAEIHGAQLDTASVLETIRDRGFGADLVDDAASGPDRSAVETQQQAAERTWRQRAIVGMGLWVPLELLHWTVSAMHWHGPWMPWVMFCGALIIIVFAGSEFYRSAWAAATRGTTNMDTLISLGATTAFVYSSVAFLLQLDVATYFSEAAGLLGIVSLGHWFEARASSRAGSAVRELLRLQPETAEILHDDGSSSVIAAGTVERGCRIAIRPGARIPVDGVVLDGRSAVDESIVTGESIPVDKGPGDTVAAGSMNSTGRLILRTTVDGRHTTVTRIAELVEKAQTSRAPIQRLADRISSVFVPAVLIIAAGTLTFWWLAGDRATAITAAVTVLIISCPCALGLATPMAVMVGAGAASQRGILIRSAETLERIGRSQQVVFDKTGTLTSGRPELTNVSPSAGYSEDRLLQLAASVEAPAEHPLARAIVRAAETRGLKLLPVSNFESVPGRGVRGQVEGQWIVVDRDPQATSRVSVDGTWIGTLALTDQLRPDAIAAVAQLQQMGIAVALLTGDRRDTAFRIGQSLGLRPDDVFAEATPESKVATVRAFRGDVVMVGDGLNDAAALAASGLGVALASGTDVAIEAAAVVIPGDRVSAVPELFGLARATLQTIRQNLFFAFLYNTLAIPLAALGLLGTSGPLWAALAMGISDFTVVGNAVRLKRRLDRARRQQPS